MREAAADALGLLGDQSAVPALTDVLFDEAINVRFAAAEALGLLGDPRSVVDLIQALDSDDLPLSAMAAMALHKIGTPEALAAIQHLWDGDRYIFETPSDADATLPHHPSPKPAAAPQEQHQQSEPPATEASAATPEETLRSIPRDLFESYLDEGIEPRGSRPRR